MTGESCMILISIWNPKKPQAFWVNYRKIPLPLLCACPSPLFRTSKLIEILQPSLHLLSQRGVCLAPLFWLVQGNRLGDKMAHQARGIITGPFELLGGTDRARRTSLRTQTAIHAFTDIDIEMSKGALLGLLAGLNANGDARNRTNPLAGKTPRTDVHINFQDPPVPEGKRFLHRLRDSIRILDRHGAPHQMRKSHGHPLKNRGDRLGDVSDVLADRAHNPSSVRYRASDTVPGGRDGSESSRASKTALECPGQGT